MLRLILAAALVAFLWHFRISGTFYGAPVSIPMLVPVFVAVVSVTLGATFLLVRRLRMEARVVWAG